MERYRPNLEINGFIRHERRRD